MKIGTNLRPCDSCKNEKRCGSCCDKWKPWFLEEWNRTCNRIRYYASKPDKTVMAYENPSVLEKKQ